MRLAQCTALDDFTRNPLKRFLLGRSHAANRLSLIIVSLLRIVAPPIAGISTVYAINNTLPPTHRPCRDCNVLRVYAYALHAMCSMLRHIAAGDTSRIAKNRVPRDPKFLRGPGSPPRKTTFLPRNSRNLPARRSSACWNTS